LAFIIEEGLDFRILERIIDSISLTAKKAGLYIVTGDLKVVERNACDKIFINTSGVGRIIAKSSLSINNIEPKDTVIVTGEIGQHGLAVLAKRGELELGLKVQSDCAALHDLLLPLLKKTGTVKFMRDPTRGGVATTLNEIAEARGLGIIIEEKKVPVSAKVRAACELLGIDPLYLPNEGRAIIVVKEDGAEKILRQLHIHPLGRKAQVIGTIAREPKGCVVLNTGVGTQRIIDMLTNEPMPRIC
jgi:hydrogenase expression/formation protein HypE